MILRTAALAERADVEKLVRRCGPEVRTYFDIHGLPGYYAAGDVLVAALDDGTDAGFVVRRRLVREYVTSVYELGVVPECRRGGVATLLLMVAADYRPVRLVVGLENTAAVAFYRARGLKVVETSESRKGQYLLRMEGLPRVGE